MALSQYGTVAIWHCRNMASYRRFLDQLALEIPSLSKAIIVRAIKKHTWELVQEKKQQPAIFIDEEEFEETKGRSKFLACVSKFQKI